MGLTAAQQFRKKLVRQRRKLVVLETQYARMRKKLRSTETHDKYLLGNMTQMAGWGKLDLKEVEIRLDKIVVLIESESKTEELKSVGEKIFVQTTNKEKSPAPKSEAERKAEAHYRIVIGGEIIRKGLGVDNRAVLLGAMKEYS